MSEPTRVSSPIYNLRTMEVTGFDSLAELALDLRWSWNHATDELWRQLEADLWETTQTLAKGVRRLSDAALCRSDRQTTSRQAKSSRILLRLA